METSPNDELLRQFAQRLLEEKHVQDVDPEVMEQLQADLVDRLEDCMNMIILKHMPEDQLATFNQLLEQGPEDQLQIFCREHIPDLQNLLSEELMAFRKTYLGLE